MSRRRTFIVTHATAATVVRWATIGNARLRKKYRGAVTACRILNRRECPLVAENLVGAFGHFTAIKFSWVGHDWGMGGIKGPNLGWYGDWHVRHGGRSRPLHSVADLRRWARTQSAPFAVATTFDNTESFEVLRPRPSRRARWERNAP